MSADDLRQQLISDFSALAAKHVQSAYENTVAAFAAKHGWTTLANLPFVAVWSAVLETHAELVRNSVGSAGPPDPEVRSRLLALEQLAKLGEM